MTGVVHQSASLPGLEGHIRLVDISRRIFLPVAALVALLVGLALIAIPLLAAGPFLPFVLFGVGLGALAGCAALSSKGQESAPSPRRSTVALPSPPAVTRSPSERPTAPVAEVPRRVAGRGSEWRVLSGPVVPGEETWLSWLPKERRRLGPADGGLVPGVVHSPGRAGNLIAFPVRNFYGGLRVPADPHRPVVSGSRPSEPVEALRDSASPPVIVPPSPRTVPAATPPSSPFTQEDLDRLFPLPGAARGVVLTDVPQRVGRAPSPGDPDPRMGPPFPQDSEEALLSELEDEVDRARSFGPATTTSLPTRASSPPASDEGQSVLEELSNPLPPHLRGTGPLIRAAAPKPGSRPRLSRAPRTVCASCSKVVVDLRMSSPCPRCLRPVCTECLREALADEGHGWCEDCSSVPTFAAAA